MRSGTVLIVDDDKLTTEAVSEYLRRTSKDFSYFVSRNSAEGAFNFLPELKEFENEEFELLITDYKLDRKSVV